ncbi:MAG: hypothetical protein K0S07_1055 [Chlamydiales bacterium]|jgi:hypothetical protein|nr:hypothetical protein [Chlamydiales bacterium]
MDYHTASISEIPSACTYQPVERRSAIAVNQLIKENEKKIIVLALSTIAAFGLMLVGITALLLSIEYPLFIIASIITCSMAGIACIIHKIYECQVAKVFKQVKPLLSLEQELRPLA